MVGGCRCGGCRVFRVSPLPGRSFRGGCSWVEHQGNGFACGWGWWREYGRVVCIPWGVCGVWWGKRGCRFWLWVGCLAHCWVLKQQAM
jgi:hypothetical protein